MRKNCDKEKMDVVYQHSKQTRTHSICSAMLASRVSSLLCSVFSTDFHMTMFAQKMMRIGGVHECTNE